MRALQGPAQGVTAVKAALAQRGLPGGEPRLPLPAASTVIADFIAENLASIKEV